MRNSPLPGLVNKNKKPMHKMPDGTMMPGATHKKSPLEKNWDFSKKADYSHEATKDTIGSKFARALTHREENSNPAVELVSAALPVGKVIKGAKLAYNAVKNWGKDKA